MRFLTLLFALTTTPAAAQSVADYYHTAAQAYIAGETAEAEAAAVEGLAIDPTDAKLQALLEKIRERNADNSGGEQEQEGADQQQSGEGEESEDAESEGEEQQDEPQEGEDGESDPQSEQQGQQQPPEDQDDQAESDRQPGDAGAEGDQPPQNPQGGGSQQTPFDVRPGEMSRADAERILRAIESDELDLLRNVQRRQARPRFVEKDW